MEEPAAWVSASGMPRADGDLRRRCSDAHGMGRDCLS